MAKLDIQKIIAEDFASKPEAAVLLEVAQRTLDRWLLEQRGPEPIMIRKRIFFEKTALAKFKQKLDRERDKKRSRRTT